MYQFTGVVKSKSDTKQVSEKFKQRELVVEKEGETYPNPVQFQFNQDRVSLLDSINTGDEVNVHFNVKGKRYEKPGQEVKHFVSLEAFKIDVKKNTSSAF